MRQLINGNKVTLEDAFSYRLSFHARLDEPDDPLPQAGRYNPQQLLRQTGGRVEDGGRFLMPAGNLLKTPPVSDAFLRHTGNGIARIPLHSTRAADFT